MENNNGGSCGICLSEVLFVVFLVLKLTKVISWSWWWVTSPLWIPIVVAIIVATVCWFMNR